MTTLTNSTALAQSSLLMLYSLHRMMDITELRDYEKQVTVPEWDLCGQASPLNGTACVSWCAVSALVCGCESGDYLCAWRLCHRAACIFVSLSVRAVTSFLHVMEAQSCHMM